MMPVECRGCLLYYQMSGCSDLQQIFTERKRISAVSGGGILHDPLGIGVSISGTQLQLIITSDSVCVIVDWTSGFHNAMISIDMFGNGRMLGVADG
jgi:hypothetical protein